MCSHFRSIIENQMWGREPDMEKINSQFKFMYMVIKWD